MLCKFLFYQKCLQEKLVFERYDSFFGRLKTILEFCNTANQFLKLEKVEIGGIRGRVLTEGVQKIHENFKDIYSIFGNRTYDSMDPTDVGFLKDFDKFNSKVWMLDRKLGAILTRAFDDCVVSENIFKLLQIFGDLVQRSLIALELSDKMPLLVVKLNDELDDAKRIFKKQQGRIKERGKPRTEKNMPLVAGQLKFALEVRNKITTSVKAFKDLSHPICYSVGADLVFKKYKQLTTLLSTYEDDVFKNWMLMVEKKNMEGLEKPLLVRNTSNGTLKVNFGRDTLTILMEVKHLKKDFPTWQIPENAKDIFKRFEDFRSYNNCLDKIVSLYNYLKTDTNEKEYRLFEVEVLKLDHILRKAETTMNWKADGIDEYLEKVLEIVSELNERIRKTQDNVIEIYKQISQWETKPLYVRASNPQEEPFLDMKRKEENTTQRYKEITAASVRIHELVKENENLFEVEMDIESSKKAWNIYLRHLDNIVADSLLQTIAVSLGYLLDETDVKKDPPPLFATKLQLCEPDIIFHPSLDREMAINFFDQAIDLSDSIFKMATLVPRIGKQKNGGKHYLDTARKHSELRALRDDYITRVEKVIAQAKEQRDTYLDYSFLWLESRQEYLYYFLQYSRQLTPKELEKLDENENSIKKKFPTLEQFKEQMDHYESLHDELKQLPSTKIFQSWFKVDITPFKATILTCTKRWSYLFKKHLLDYVVDSLADLDSFIDKADRGLLTQVHEGDYEGLIKIMEFLKLVKEKQRETDEMFDPLKNIISLLRKYGVIFPEVSLVQLHELPIKWANTKRLSLFAKQTVGPLQGMEIGKLKTRIEDYERSQRDFRNYYTQMQFFSYKSQSPYEQLSKANLELEKLENEVKELQSEASLFEILVPKFPLTAQCRKENKMLKQLWDYTFLVRTSIEEWKTTIWMEIDVENMDMECKKFAKDVRGLDKAMRNWHAYLGLETTVKNMLTSLRAVGELQNSAIRDRHWDQLVQATKVRFTMSDDTTLADLLSLNLHNFEDEVHNIVDKVCKEMAMEKMLKDLENNWKNMEFDYEVHESGYKLLRASEELVETLEENQVQTQNMMTSKYIAFFLTEMSAWQKTLGMVDTVMAGWMEVQRTWAHLQSIFLGSEDIRIQLPKDTERFDEIDKEFKILMTEMAKTPNVVIATNVESLPEQLSDLHKRLILCEKALSEYLETKRLAFPRFYFASSADLLDILSNGNDPQKVSKHLTKLFDSMAKLKMTEEEGKLSKIAHSMVAKDGEVVKFIENCPCDGQVEVWLNRLLDSMRATIRDEFAKSMTTYEDTPREKWLLLYPAQVALAGTQICWTTEVSTAFSRLEEGYENALKDYYKKQISQLNSLIFLLLGNLDKGGRQKVMTICTIDVHSRDTVGKMITQKIESNTAFSWQSQLRHRWDEKEEDCFANICDAQFRYSHEYLGNTPRLVITPLTDRCYITLTQSLHLIMGGAPQGPAGTGKTETTKDLGRAIGIMVYVFNCSEQMDYKSCGNIFKGLAQTGAWGCFDEFNRITVEVLSVIAVQVKSIQDAIREKKITFDFMNSNIPMNPTIGYFITMNPGYAGRAELPENLKVLFRPCAMCVPDLRLICEIMLVAEGFLEARTLSRKFITLYTLCKELLSKQDHYDWGLRAIKSVLVVAGSLKRSERDRPEDQVLMRALRDFNTPKIVADDTPVFLGLISDLFPNLDVPRKRDPVFEKSVKMAACDLKLQPEENFVMKICQLDELLTVRHSVFIVGDSGTGKTKTWKTLIKTYQNLGQNPTHTDLNPKAVTNDELYGVINAATREWKDGLFSNIMRDLANLTTEGPKWIVLDGDIDPMWIESLNTVMDDNKILTLASNERIAVTPEMKLIFEISNLRTATPATVSRAGILYINPGDLGWNPYVTSWVETRENTNEKANLTLLFDKYIPVCIDIIGKRFKKITPIPAICHIQILCSLLEALITPKNIPKDASEEIYEIWFVFALVWSLGSALFHDGSTDYKAEFSKWFMNEFRALEFPQFSSVFDVYVDPSTQQFASWVDKVPKFELDPDMPLQACLVHNSETIRIRFFMDILVNKKFPVMLIGLAGSGKTLMLNEKLGQMDEEFLIANVPFNFYYSAELTQKILEKPLEKKAGKTMVLLEQKSSSTSLMT